MKSSGIYELQMLNWTPNLKSDRNFELERPSNGLKRDWSRFMEKSIRWSKVNRSTLDQKSILFNRPVYPNRNEINLNRSIQSNHRFTESPSWLTGSTRPSWWVAGESPVSVTGGDCGDSGGRGRWSGGGDDFRRRCVRYMRAQRRTSGGAWGLVQAPIVALLVSMASSRWEEHDGGLGLRTVGMNSVWSRRTVSPANSDDGSPSAKVLYSQSLNFLMIFLGGLIYI